MKLPSIIVSLIALTSICHAQDLSFAFEGDESERDRLSDLQGSTTPPPLKLSNWRNSEELNVESLKGKIVLLDFWATWCGPCIASIPHNNEISEKYSDQVVFIGICHPTLSDKMAETISKHSIKYPVAVDESGETNNAYAVNGYPDYYIIDQEGRLVVADCANDQVEAVIEKLLK